MNLFELVKANVAVPEAAERYGLKPGRHEMVCCPFHNDRHPSMKLNPDFYYCFGCGEKGDVIDLVSKLFGLGMYEAAKKLAEDFGLDPEHPPSGPVPERPGRSYEKAVQEDELYCTRVLCNYLHLLKDWKMRYAPASMDDEPDDRFVEACQMEDHIGFLADMLLFGDPEERLETMHVLMKDGMITRLEERLERVGKEVSYGEAELPAAG